MPYYAFTLSALLVLFVVNFDIFRSKKTSKSFAAINSYKAFVISIAVLYVVDTIWGILEMNKLSVPLYVDNVIYYVVMGATIFLWTRYAVKLMQGHKIFDRVLEIVGYLFFSAEIILLIINIFHPVLFTVELETCTYQTYVGRDVMIFIQIGMYVLGFIYASVSMIMAKSFKRRDFAMVLFSLINATFITVQLFFPTLPLYTVGMLLGTCVLSSFVINDIREEYRLELEKSKKTVQRQEQELGEAILLAHTDQLTGVKNKHAYVELEDEVDRLIAKDEMESFALVVCDLNGLKIINDTYGHDKGDQYIIDSVKTIKKYFGDDLYRFGGDEFVIVLKGESYKNRKSLLNSFNDYIDSCLDTKLPIISAGLSIYKRGEDNTFRAVFNRADKSMYARKQMLKEHS